MTSKYAMNKMITDRLFIGSKVAAACAMLLVAGCAADGQQEGMGEVPILLTTSVVELGDASTRASDSQGSQLKSSQTFYAYFDGGTTVDHIIYEADGSGGTSLTDGFTQPYFTFSGSQTTIHAYHPATVTEEATSFTVQRYQNNLNYTASDLMYATSGMLSKSGAPAVGNLAFRHKMAKINVYVTAGAGVSAITYIRIIGGYRTINITDGKTCTLGTELSDANTASSYITLWDEENGGPYITVDNRSALIPPQTISGDFLQVSTDKGAVKYTLSGMTFESGKQYTVRLTVTSTSIAEGTVGIDDWEEGWSTQLWNYGTHQIISEEIAPVTMSFSTTLEWSNMNLGAQTETDYGVYFAWGETKGFSGDGRRYYAPDYLLGNGGTKETLKYTKYHGGISAYVADGATLDYLTELLPEDDAVSVLWGNGWRMPTKEEMEALLEAAADTEHYEWIWYDPEPGYKDSGHAGYLLKEKGTDYTLFFPASGYLGQNDWGLIGKDALYWTSSMAIHQTYNDLSGTTQTDSPWPRYAYYMRLHEEDENNPGEYLTPKVSYDANRYVGLNVRPVRTIRVED